MGSKFYSDYSLKLYIQKLDSSGVNQWLLNPEILPPYALFHPVSYSKSIQIDSTGHIYITGGFKGSIIFGTDTLHSNAYSNIYNTFVVKLDTNGNYVWAKHIKGTKGCNIKGVALDVTPSGDIYTTGTFNDTIEFIIGSDTTQYFDSMYVDNHFVQTYITKLDSSGQFKWVKFLSDSSHIETTDLKINSDENVYTVGRFTNSLDFDPGIDTFRLHASPYTQTMYINKLDSNGNFINTKTIFSNQSSFNPRLDIDKNNHLYISGSFSDTVDLDPGIDSMLAYSYGDYFSIVTKLDSNEEFIWGQVIGEGNNRLFSNSIACDGIGNAYVTGIFQDTVDLIAGPDSLILISTAPGVPGIDAFNVKINGCNSSYTDVISTCLPLTWLDGNTYYSDNNTAVFITTNSNGCDSIINLNLTFQNNSSIDTIYSCNSFTWIDGITYTQNNNSAMHTLTNSFGCDSIITLNLILDTFDITVSQLGNTVFANLPGATYQWLNCTYGYTIMNGATTQSYTMPAFTSDYAVEITYNGCSDTSTCYSAIPFGINETNNDNVFSIYPNPTTGIIHFEIGNTKNVQIKVYNELGRTLYNKTLSPNNLKSLDLSKFDGKIFIIELSNTQHIKQFKIFKY